MSPLPAPVLPDAVVIVRAFLLTCPEITALVSSRIYSQSPATPTYPYITVQRIGGGQTEHRIDSASLQVDCWGATESSASQVARTTRAALLSAWNYVHTSGVLLATTEELGLSWQPDTVRTPPQPRFLFGVAAHLRPNP